ncbi:MAG: ATP-binding cassette domain-containing protein [Chloroflexi bacterium]|nr:ATP-binding cassette domain-containing protein [Chloroflexota bacterium]
MNQADNIAISVDGAYKVFGQQSRLQWPLRKNGANGSNKSNGNGNGRSPTVAVDHVSFEVRRGEIFGVLGPNGGGKSTLIRLIATLLISDEGRITVFGHDVVRQPMAAQRMINRVSVEASFFKKLSPMENLLYGARLYGVSGDEIRQQVQRILKRLAIPDKNVNRPMEEMSRGMQQKVAIARALLSSPILLLLDEPTTGLDPRSKREVQTFVRELRDVHGTTILLTTHDMVEAEQLCDRIAIMDSGRVVALDTPQNLKALAPRQANASLAGANASLAGANASLAGANASLAGHEPTLEEVFLELTGKKLISETDEPI